MKVCPAIVAVPVRAAPVFAAILSVTLPGPVCDAPLGIVIHDALLADVHAHDRFVITLTVDVPPAAGCESLEGVME